MKIVLPDEDFSCWYISEWDGIYVIKEYYKGMDDEFDYLDEWWSPADQ